MWDHKASFTSIRKLEWWIKSKIKKDRNAQLVENSKVAFSKCSTFTASVAFCKINNLYCLKMAVKLDHLKVISALEKQIL